MFVDTCTLHYLAPVNTKGGKAGSPDNGCCVPAIRNQIKQQWTPKEDQNKQRRRQSGLAGDCDDDIDRDNNDNGVMDAATMQSETIKCLARSCGEDPCLLGTLCQNMWPHFKAILMCCAQPQQIALARHTSLPEQSSGLLQE